MQRSKQIVIGALVLGGLWFWFFAEIPASTPELDKSVSAKQDASKVVGSLETIASPGSRAGEERTITLPGGAEMRMVWCPPGTFTMGCPPPESEIRRKLSNGDETPHKVTLTCGFWMAKTEVTQQQWHSVMEKNPSSYIGHDRPVENVSWHDCRHFCLKSGLDLPTEAQWEYACRAGDERDALERAELDESCWYIDNAKGGTHPVGQKRANAWGLFDMLGNVREWCADWYGGDYGKDPATDPRGASSGTERVYRGGAWNSYSVTCRPAERGRNGPDYDTRNNIGLRPVKICK